MKDRVSDKNLEGWIRRLKAWSSGRMDGDVYKVCGSEIRGLIKVCEDLKDARALLSKTSWLRKPEKKKR